jgi:sugar/nucleoside kinase (ribokinase family)
MKKVLGIGNALVDIIFFLKNDELLSQFALPKGSMQLVDAKKAQQVEEASAACNKYMASGGSAANTVHGIARLGMPAAFVGTVGRDEVGRFFEQDLKACAITPLLSISDTQNTGQAISLVSPGGERTFATYLGAAVEVMSDNFDTSLFRQYDHLHLEGYLVPNRVLTEKILTLAQEYGMTLSLDLASYNVVESNLDFLKSITTRFNPLVFANEDEARAFTGQTDPRKALEVFASLCDTAVVKVGSKGSLIYHKGSYYTVNSIPVKCMDTTGAGDLYAAGFLYGFLNQYHPEVCGKIGSLLAGKVIEEAGAKISDASWKYILENLPGILAC